jgi:hypothetical protein
MMTSQRHHRRAMPRGRFSLNALIASTALASVTTLILGVPQAAMAARTPQNTIKNIMVIELENESYAATFSPTSAATYLNTTLLSEGELIPNWFATGHVSLDNYIAQISGQGSTPSTNSDCINAATLSSSLIGQYFNVSPGNDDANKTAYPGQVDGDGCIYPAPHKAAKNTSALNGARTIGDQLDEKYKQVAFSAKGIVYTPGTGPVLWREYAEDMGNTPSRDNGDADPMGGTDCGHPLLGGADGTNAATAADQYATRHNGFMYFHSVIDNQARCDAHVVPLGTVSVGTGANGADVFAGHLATDLASIATTPKFMFVTPNLCNDGHDATCKGVNTEGTSAGGLAGADTWLKHWMPMVFNSPAYQSGQLLVVLTFDEGSVLDTAACNTGLTADTGICHYPTGPNMTSFGFSPLLGAYHYQSPSKVYPGGGQVGAVLFNSKFIQPGSVNSTGQYNHYSALRSYEDLLQIRNGGDDGLGHLGYAAQADLAGNSFGSDVFNATPAN